MAQDESKSSSEGFRFRAQIFDTANTYAITYYILSVEIFGFDLPEYVLAKRYSDFFAFHTRLCARFHHKRLPKIPSKTFVKTHDDEFITQRKNALNKYLQGVCERLYLQNATAVWDFFELTDKVNPYLHRFKVLHLTTLQCNDYRNLPPPSHAPPKPPKQDELPAPPSPQMNNNISNNLGFDGDDLVVDQNEKNSGDMAAMSTPGGNNPDLEHESVTSRTLARTATFLGNLWNNIKEKGKEIKERKEKAKREWTVVYGTFLDLNTYLTVSTIHADNTASNWWDTVVENVFETQIDRDSDDEPDTSAIDANKEAAIEPADVDADRNGQLLAQRVEDDKDEKDSVNSLHTIGLNDATAAKLIQDATGDPMQAKIEQTDDSEQPRVSGHETTSLRYNEMYLGKVQLWHWRPNNEILPKESQSGTEYMIRPVTTFPMVRNRPDCAVFDASQLLLAVGTSKGKILLLRVNEQTMKFEMIDWLPHMFGSHVTSLIIVPGHKVFYKPNVITDAIQSSRLPVGSASLKSSNLTGYLYAVSNDCHLSVFDLSRGNCIGHLQTGITGNLGVTFCFERVFVCNQDNHIISLIRSSSQGTPVPEMDLYGHSKTVTCLLADERNNRLFSGATDNSIGVWYYDKDADRLIQTQHLKAVNKSRGFTALCVCHDIKCLAAGADNGFVTLWYEGAFESVFARSSPPSGASGGSGDDAQQGSGASGNVGNMGKGVERDAQGRLLKMPVFSQNNLRNGAVWSNLSSEKKSWKCLYTWRAHKTQVTCLQYYEKYNVLMSCGADGTVRMVFLCDPKGVPPMQLDAEKMASYRIKMREDMKALYGIDAESGQNLEVGGGGGGGVDANEEEKMDQEADTSQGSEKDGEKNDPNIRGNLDDKGANLEKVLEQIEFKRNVSVELFEKKLTPYFVDVNAIENTQYADVKQDMMRKEAETGNQWYNLIND